MKKIISIALALLMVAVMLPVMAMAEENALPAAGEDGVTVLKDHVVLSSGGLGSRTIDLNGYTISCTSASGLSFNKLTVRDSSADSSAAGTGAITCKISANAYKSSLTLEGGTIAEVEMSGSESSLSISGGKIEKMSLSGSATKIEITDGTVTNGVFVSGADANVTVSGGVVGKGFSMRGANSKVTVTGGTFTDITDTSKIKRYVDNDALIISGNGNLYVGASATEAIENAAEGDEFEVLQGSDISNVPAGVKITNKTGEVITVNGETVEEGGDYKYTPPTDNKVIVIITPTEDTPKADDQKNPSTGANDFVGVAAAMAVVSLLGAAAVIRKK